MGADKRYKKAADAYEEAAANYKTYMADTYMKNIDKYSGQEGWNTAKKNAADYAQTAGEVARSGAYKAAKTSGYGKAASFSLANDANNTATTQNLQTGMNMGLQNNQQSTANENAKLQAQQNAVNNAAQNYQVQEGKSKTGYNQTMGTVAAVSGTVGSIFSAISDERLKDIYIDMDEFRKR